MEISFGTAFQLETECNDVLDARLDFTCQKEGDLLTSPVGASLAHCYGRIGEVALHVRQEQVDSDYLHVTICHSRPSQVGLSREDMLCNRKADELASQHAYSVASHKCQKFFAQLHHESDVRQLARAKFNQTIGDIVPLRPHDETKVFRRFSTWPWDGGIVLMLVGRPVNPRLFLFNC